MSDFGFSMPKYFQNMPEIGKPIAEDAANKQAFTEIEAEAEALKQEFINSGKADEDVHKAGQLTPTERLNYLIDEGSWCPLDTLYDPYDNEDKGTAVLTGLAKIHDKWCCIVVSDHKKLAGVWLPGQSYRICRATEISKELRIPLIYVLNCSGIKLSVWDQGGVYTGRVSGGTPFWRHAELEQMGIPVIVGLFGTNPAGGGYHSISPTIIIAHEKANFAVGGVGIVSGMNPKGYVDEEAAEALINATKGAKKVAPPGSVSTHYNETGFMREVYPTEEGVLDAIKKYVDCAPCYNENYFRVAEPMEPKYACDDIYSIVRADHRRIYDMHDVIARLTDNSEFQEFKPEYGLEIVCGLARVNGLLTAFIANNQGLYPNYPDYKDEPGVGGKLFREGLIKMSEFVTLTSRDRIPIVWIQDVFGIDVGDPSEKAEMLGLGQGLIYSVQNSVQPQMEITLRKGSTAGHYVMCGPQANDHNAFSLGTAATKMYVMHPETAAAAMYARRLVKDKDSGKDLEPTIKKMNDLIVHDTKASGALNCAKQGWVDELVNMNDLRKYVCAFVGASYQNPKSVCPFHQMMTPRVLVEWNKIMSNK